MIRWLIWLVFVIAFTAALEVRINTEQMPGAETINTYRTLISKTIHVALFSTLTVLSAWVPMANRYRWSMMFFVMGYAWATEMLQLELNLGRTGTLGDIGFDIIGILIGVVLSWRLWTRQ